MTTKEIAEITNELTNFVSIEILINNEETEAVVSLDPENINYQYSIQYEEFKTYFYEIYLEGNQPLLDRLLILLNKGLEQWTENKDTIIDLVINFENKEHLTPVTITKEEFIQIAGIKIKYIESLISKIEELITTPKTKTLQPPHEPAPEVVNTELLEQIKQRFEDMDKKGYQYAFRTEDEFDSFCNVLALYFDNSTFNDIETIQLNPRTQTRIASTLNLIYSKFIKDGLSLKTNKDFFRIVRFLAPYKEKTDNEIYKALIR